MKGLTENLWKYIAIACCALIVSCEGDDGDDDDDDLDVPTTYEWTRNGESTVNYGGQADRLDMLTEMKAYLRQGDAGELITAEKLMDMFNNENEPWESADLNASTKQLGDKTFLADVSFYEDLFTEAGEASADYVENQTVASVGISGRLQRGTSENYILVNDKGWEFVQIAEKGLMGSVFLHQIFNVYLTDDKIGDDVNNTDLVEGKNYTAMEHHWDEAFGYWGVPVDFPAELPAEASRFWANYTYGREEQLETVTKLKNAFLTGRAAIVAKDYETRDEQAMIIYENFELAVAATAVHYLNESIADLSNNPEDTGNLFHHLSEGYGFIMALRLSPFARITVSEVDDILSNDLGENSDFWNVTTPGLENAKSTIVSKYSELASIANEL